MTFKLINPIVKLLVSGVPHFSYLDDIHISLNLPRSALEISYVSGFLLYFQKSIDNGQVSLVLWWSINHVNNPQTQKGQAVSLLPETQPFFMSSFREKQSEQRLALAEVMGESYCATWALLARQWKGLWLLGFLIGEWWRSLEHQLFSNEHGGRLYFNNWTSCTGAGCRPMWRFWCCCCNFNG